MNISQEEIRKFKNSYFKHTGQKVNNDQAYELFWKLINLYKIIY